MVLEALSLLVRCRADRENFPPQKTFSCIRCPTTMGHTSGVELCALCQLGLMLLRPGPSLSWRYSPKHYSGAKASDPLVAKLACSDRVNDVAFSPNGKLIAAGYGWNTQGGVKVWDVASRTVVAALSRRKG